MALLLVGGAIWTLFPRDRPVDPFAYWFIPLFVGVMLTLFGALLYPTYRSVRVTDEGVWVGGRLEIRRKRIGTVEVLDGSRAWLVGMIGMDEPGQRVRWRNNLYGGGYGWGKAVRVEQLRPGSPSVWWLLPGPRAEELAEALRQVRDAPAGAGR